MKSSKIIKTCLVSFSVIFIANAQSISPSAFNSIGTSFQTPTAGMDINIGEAVTGIISNSNSQITQGLLQPLLYFLDLKIFLQGYYLGGSTMANVIFNQTGMTNTIGIADTITVELREVNDPSKATVTSKVLLHTNGNTSCSYTKLIENGSYWIVIKHRNTIQSWSAQPVTFYSNIPVAYDFTFSANKTFGNNVTDVYNEDVWSMYTGDLNQDEYIDIFDFPIFDYDNQTFVQIPIYSPSDMNGDGFADIFDFPIYDANNQNFNMAMHP